MKSLKTALINIRRMPYKSMAAILMITITFFVAYSFSMLILGSQQVLEFFEARPKVMAFFDIKAENSEISEVENKLRSLNYVEEISIVSKQEALQYYQEKQDNPLLLELVTADILPASIEVSTSGPEYLQLVEQELGKFNQIDDIVLQKDVVEQLSQWTQAIRLVGIALISILLFLSITIIISIISFKVSHQRRSISILRIIGAGSGYIITPYIYEGFLYGLLGSIFGWGLMYAGFLYLSPWLQTIVGDIINFPLSWEFFALQLGLGTSLALFFGGFASVLAARKLIKK
jgi:cell division transport system permease protein